MNIKVKLVSTDSEYESVLAIRREVFIEEQNVPEDIEIDEYETTSDHFLVLVDDEPAGCGRMRIKDSYAKFERIATLKEFRGQGIGRELMKFMMNHANVKFPHALPYMHSQADAVPFYQKLGWTTQGDVFDEANIPHQTMILSKNVN